MSENKRNGAFRHKKVYFTQVSNDILRNTGLTLGAKGLFSLIQSYVTIEGFTLYKTTLMNDCSEGETAFNRNWKELKDKGYLVQYKLKDENNNFYYEYELLDEPIKTVEKTDENHKTENPQVQKVTRGNSRCGSSRLGNHGVYNNTDYNNTYSMYVCMYENHLIATKTFKDFLAKIEIHNRMDIDLFEHLLIEVMNNNRVKKKDKYFMKVLKETVNNGVRTISDYENYLEEYKAKTKAKYENKTKKTTKSNNEPKKVKTRFHNINTSFDNYSEKELEEVIATSQYYKSGHELPIRKLYLKAMNKGLGVLLTEDGKKAVVDFATKNNMEIPKQ